MSTGPVKLAVYQPTQVCIIHLFWKDARGEKKKGVWVYKGFLEEDKSIYMSCEKSCEFSLVWGLVWVLGLGFSFFVCVVLIIFLVGLLLNYLMKT